MSRLSGRKCGRRIEGTDWKSWECRPASNGRDDAVHIGLVSLEEILVSKLLLTQATVRFQNDDSARNMLFHGGY